MPKVCVTLALDADAELVWQRIGGFHNLPDWNRTVRDSTMHEGGRLRRLETADGAVIVERLLEFSESARSYSYTIEASALPLTSYQATLRVLAGPDPVSCQVEWSSSFYAEPEQEAPLTALFERLYQAGLDELRRGLGL